LAEKR